MPSGSLSLSLSVALMHEGINSSAQETGSPMMRKALTLLGRVSHTERQPFTSFEKERTLYNCSNFLNLCSCLNQLCTREVWEIRTHSNAVVVLTLNEEGELITNK
ncbi:hypothetical protein CEXT_311001 [Caerostris extrusa]|uniref:Uncharacterized protein n=1 Tax=Caerostris extrusa TaxID=172846 RepID=A0AAV4RD69_CAEEX|nr:hypothetical protein CEXT_311001 [Caerostris extrusa]